MGKPPVATFDEDFAAFWAIYPRRIGRLIAHKAYAKVRRGGISHEELVDGIRQYIATKPAYADFCHPTTWLNQGRWMDDVPLATRLVNVLAPGDPCQHDPPCPTRWGHGKLVEAEATGDLELVAVVRKLYGQTP